MWLQSVHVSISVARNKCKKKIFFVLFSHKSAKYVFKGVVRTAPTRETTKLNYFCNIERHNKHLFPHKNDSNFQSHFDLTVHLPESGMLRTLRAHFSPFKASGRNFNKILKTIILHNDVMNVPSQGYRTGVYALPSFSDDAQRFLPTVHTLHPKNIISGKFPLRRSFTVIVIVMEIISQCF